MILELPNYVDSDTVDHITNKINDYRKTRNISKYSGYNREGTTIRMTGDPELKEVDDILQKIFISVSRDVVGLRYKPRRDIGDSGYEYHCYDPGEICNLHCDGEFTENSLLLRIASVILHLNTVENGGELIFPNQNQSIKTEKGKVVIFPPYGMYQHYTTPSDQKREVVVTWFVYNGINILRT